MQAGVIALTAFISPMRSDRKRVRDIIGGDAFVEVYCRCPLAVCEARDVKGMYKKARAGEIKNYTGISSPYEEPAHPDLVLDSGSRPLGECVEAVIRLLRERKIIEQG